MKLLLGEAAFVVEHELAEVPEGAFSNFSAVCREDGPAFYPSPGFGIGICRPEDAFSLPLTRGAIGLAILSVREHVFGDPFSGFVEVDPAFEAVPLLATLEGVLVEVALNLFLARLALAFQTFSHLLNNYELITNLKIHYKLG